MSMQWGYYCTLIKFNVGAYQFRQNSIVERFLNSSVLSNGLAGSLSVCKAIVTSKKQIVYDTEFGVGRGGINHNV